MPYLKNKKTGQMVFVPDAGPTATAVGPRNPKPAHDMSMDNARLELERQKFAAQQAADARKAALDRQAADIEARKAEVTAPIRQQALTDFQSAMTLYPKINQLESQFNRGPGATSGVAGLLDYLPNFINEGAQNFDRSADQLRGFVKKTQGFTGGEGNTAAEAKMNIGAFIPSSSDLDSTTRNNIKSLRSEQAKGLATAVSTLGGIPDQNGNVTPVPTGYRIGQYPQLDAEVSGLMSVVPIANRAKFLLDAKRRFEQRQASRRSKPQAAAAPQPDVIDFNDWGK